jgi:hypothetical protein
MSAFAYNFHIFPRPNPTNLPGRTRWRKVQFLSSSRISLLLFGRARFRGSGCSPLFGDLPIRSWALQNVVFAILFVYWYHWFLATTLATRHDLSNLIFGDLGRAINGGRKGLTAGCRRHATIRHTSSERHFFQRDAASYNNINKDRCWRESL